VRHGGQWNREAGRGIDGGGMRRSMAFMHLIRLVFVCFTHSMATILRGEVGRMALIFEARFRPDVSAESVSHTDGGRPTPGAPGAPLEVGDVV